MIFKFSSLRRQKEDQNRRMGRFRQSTPVPQRPLGRLAPKDLGSTKTVLDWLAHELAQESAKNLFPRRLRKRIARGIHRVDQPATVDEIALPADQGLIEVDLQSSGATLMSASRIIRMSPVALAKPNRTASPLPRPSCTKTLMSLSSLRCDPAALVKSVVFGVAFDKDQFGVRAHGGSRSTIC